jgi:hypothetical protein
MSQGSNAGTGAFKAFTGRSAAKADPETDANTIANKAVFFISVLNPQASSLATQQTKKLFCCIKKLLFGNVRRAKAAEKRKRKSTAAFLGFSSASENVVDVCDISTTTIGVERPLLGSARQKDQPAAAFHEPHR